MLPQSSPLRKRGGQLGGGRAKHQLTPSDSSSSSLDGVIEDEKEKTPSPVAVEPVLSEEPAVSTLSSSKMTSPKKRRMYLVKHSSENSDGGCMVRASQSFTEEAHNPLRPVTEIGLFSNPRIPLNKVGGKSGEGSAFNDMLNIQVKPSQLAGADIRRQSQLAGADTRRQSQLAGADTRRQSQLAGADTRRQSELAGAAARRLRQDSGYSQELIHINVSPDHSQISAS